MIGRLLDKPPRTVMALTVATVVSMTVLVAAGLIADYRATVAATKREFALQAGSIRDRLDMRLLDAGRGLREIAAVADENAAANGARLLAAYVASHPGVVCAALLGADGAVVAEADGQAGDAALRGFRAALPGIERAARHLTVIERGGVPLLTADAAQAIDAAGSQLRPAGFAVAELGPGWFDRLGAELGLDDQQVVTLATAPERTIWSVAGAPGLSRAALQAASPERLTQEFPLGDGGLALTVDQGWNRALGGFRDRLYLALGFCLFAGGGILVAGWAVSGTLVRLRSALMRRNERMEALVVASERLARASSVAEIVLQTERVGVSVLGCERMSVTLATDPAAPAAPLEIQPPEIQPPEIQPPEIQPPEIQPHARTVDLRNVQGSRLGWLTAWFAPTEPVTDEQTLLLDQFARNVAGSLSVARQLAETTAARAQSEFVLSSITEGMYVVDREWIVRYTNEAALSAGQAIAAHVLGRRLWEVDPALIPVRHHFEQAMSGDTVKFVTFHQLVGRYLEIRIFPFPAGITVFFRDVTAERESRERKQQDQSLESLGLLTRGIVHDVNNMLTVMLGNLEMLMIEAEEAAPPRTLEIELSRAGLRAGQTAVDFMRRLQVFSRQQHLQPDIVDMRTLVAGLPAMLGRRVGALVELRVQAEPDLWNAIIDTAELESAVLNLAINSADAMPDGGQLTIAARNTAIGQQDAEHFGLPRPGDYIELSVRDTGVGIPPELLSRVFDPYVTTKPRGQGSGLGLSMVYGFARQSGGGCSIFSEHGSGTTVTLFLPRGVDQPERADETFRMAVPRESDAPAGRATILLVEDHDLVRAHTAQLLTSFGYAVQVAADGAQGLQLLTDGLRPDLLLTDVILPGGMNGREVAEAATAMIPGLPVLYVSGYTDNVLQENGRLRPGVDLLSKPFSAQALAERVRRRIGPAQPGGAAQVAPSAASL